MSASGSVPVTVQHVAGLMRQMPDEPDVATPKSLLNSL
jgi:hypothetical protein